MVSLVKSRSNHYETLGLAPSASHDEIARAFASLIRLRPETSVARLAQLSIAYETLRDPDKRRAYDASLEPVPAEPNAAPLIETPPEPAEEPRLASFIAASLREPGKPAVEEIAPEHPSQPPVSPRTDQPVELTFHPGGSSATDSAEPASVRRYAGIGAGVSALGILGVVISLPDRTVERSTAVPDQAQSAVTVGLPPPTPVEATALASNAPAEAIASAEREQPASASDAPAAVNEIPTPPALSIELPAEENVAVQTSAEAPSAETPAEPPVEAAPAATSTASMPLPNRTIARTIERIGYSCGDVVSTTGVEGGALGVFRVTCSSGQSYQATPVNGRYRFRRWGRQ